MYLCHTSCELLNVGTLQAYLTTVANWLRRHPYDVISILMGNYDVVDVDIAWDPTISPYLVPLDEDIAKSHYDIADYKGLNALIGVDARTHVRYGVTAPSLYLIRPDGYVGFRCHPSQSQTP